MLIVLAGLPAAGKSAFAADLGRALNCAVLGVDQAEAAMWRAGVSPSGPTHHAAYLAVGALAAEQVALGHDVIVDAVNGPEMARAQWRELAGRLQVELKFIVVECGDDKIYRDRLAHRTKNIDGFPAGPTWPGLLQRRAAFPPWTDERLTLDSVHSRETNLQAAVNYLATPSGRARPSRTT
jgi:predicted kinase